MICELLNGVGSSSAEKPIGVPSRTGRDKGREGLSFQKLASFTVTRQDAQKYLYSDSAARRVHRWKDIQVNLYI